MQYPPNNLHKIGARIIVIAGGIPGAIAVFMGITQKEHLMGIHLFVFIFSMALIFALGSTVLMVGLFKEKRKLNQ